MEAEKAESHEQRQNCHDEPESAVAIRTSSAPAKGQPSTNCQQHPDYPDDGDKAINHEHIPLNKEDESQPGAHRWHSIETTG
jgi:hypothetical protein